MLSISAALSHIMPQVLARTRPRWPLLCGTVLIALGLARLSRATATQGYLGGLFGPFLLVGIGIGLSYVPIGAAFSGRLRIAEMSADSAARRPAATGSGSS